MKFSKPLLALASAVVLLGALAGPTSARVLSFSHQSLRGTWASIRFSGGFGTTDCPVTIEGSLHSRTVAKVVASLVGYVTRATIGACRTGSATILSASLPWHITYGGFTGALPNITGGNAGVINASFSIREPVFGITCLTSTTAGTPIRGVWEINARVLESITLSGSIPTSCGVNGTISGTTTSISSQEGARITVTLI